MPVEQAEILKEVVDALRGNADLLAITGDRTPSSPSGEARVYNHVPDDYDLPYVVVSWQGDEDWDTKSSLGFDGSVHHECVTDNHGDVDVLEMVDIIRAEYEDNPISLTSGKIVCWDYQSGATQQNVFDTHRITAIFNVLVDDEGVGGAPVPPAAGGALKILNGKADANIDYRAGTPGAMASAQSSMNSNPSDADVVQLTTYFLPSGATVGLPETADFTFRSVLASPYVVVGNGSVDVRIEASTAGTLANLISANADSSVNTNAGNQWIATTTVTNPSGTTLDIEQDFDGTFPNGNTAIDETTGSSFLPTTASYAGGADGVPEVITDAEVCAFQMEFPSSGPNLLLGDATDNNFVDSTPAPEESAITVVGDAIVDTGATAFLNVSGVADNVYRCINIVPTTDLATGTATVSWTWDDVPFEVHVTKTAS